MRTCIALMIVSLFWATCSAAEPEKAKGKLAINTSNFGKTADGTPIELYELVNGKLTAKIITYGAIVTELDVPDRDGKPANIVLGFDNLDGYLGAHPYFGAIVGRVANRIAKGKFSLDGKDYTTAVNNGPNSLHGGLKGFDKVVWKAKNISSPNGPAVRLTYVSADGEEGYPGKVTANVSYTLVSEGLEIFYEVSSDKATPINITNHTYFNLAGPDSGSILDHELMLSANMYTPVDDTLIPTGEVKPVKDTPLDFTKPTPIGKRIGELKGEPGGYDHNFVVRGTGLPPALIARVYEPKSGRVMEVMTTEPGVQFYTGNFLDGTIKGKGGTVYKKHQGFCLETQHFPDSVNHPNFPSTILKPGTTYRQMTRYRFSTR